MKVLVVSPVFHGYWEAIVGALRVHGHDVVGHCYDADPAWTRRFANALSYRVPAVRASVERHATARAISALRETRPDAVLVVRGDSLGAEWWDACVRSSAKISVWLYDELDRMRYETSTLEAAEDVFSYSPRDVEALRGRGLSARLLPDGFDSLLRFTPRRSAAVSFVGARYRPRETSLAALVAAGVPVEAYGREWSRHPWDVLRTRRWRSAPLPSHRDLPRADYYGVMAGSLATINIHGEAHDGLSMRTYEAPGVGALQLIDRPEVAEFYDVGTEVIVFRSDEELVEHAERARRDPAWAERIREAGRARTLAQHTLIHRMDEVQQQWR
ncbi:MAG: glycosyltransferase [Actinobacteria bacterium]|nr:glycosyltransferase [Actinomycetota bacterium]